MFHAFSRLFAPRQLTNVHYRGRGTRLFLEALEDRIALDSYTVNALGDAGAGAGLNGDCAIASPKR